MNSWTQSAQRLWRWMAALIGLSALLLALGIGAFRLAIDLLPGYQQRVVERVREATGLTLEFDSVYARIGRYGPEVVFRGARVLPEYGDEALVTAESGRVSLSIPRTIWFRRIEVGRVAFIRPRLSFVITSDGRIQLVGQSALRQPDAERSTLTLDRLPRGHLAVTDAVLDVLDLRSRQGRFQLTGANVDVVRKGDDVELSGRVALPEHLGAFIDFDGEASGNLADTASVDWRARIDARDLDLEQWAATLPDSFIVPAAGRGSIRVSARGTGRELSSLRLEPRISGLRFAGSQDEFTRVAGDLRVQRDGDTISLQATGLELSRAGAAWRPTSLEARLSRKAGRVTAVEARADYLRIENLAVFMALMPAGTMRDRLSTLAPRGELFGLDMTVVDSGVKRLPDITGRLRFTNIGFGPFGKSAGVTGFDGAVEGRGAGGVVHLATRDATIDWPQQWRAPAAVVRGDGRIEWHRFDNGVRLWLDDAVVDSGHGVARGKLRMLLRPGELPLMDLSATAANFDVSQLWRYLQTGRLQPKTIRWLDAAFRAGRVTEATVSVTGPTRGFPYREGQGRFHANGRATGVNLHYAPGWPELRGVDTAFEFDGPAMHAVATRGSVGGIAFTQAEVNSADLRDAVFAARGSTRTDAGRAIRMLQGTPLAPSFGALFADLAGSGPVAAEIAMYLPIKNFDRRVVTVMANLDGVKLRHRQQPYEATDIAGDLWVRNREIHAPALSGRALGGRWQAAIETTTALNGNLRTQVNARGSVQGAALQPIARLPKNAGLAGSAEWRAALDVERNADPKRPARGTVRLSSDLRGLASKLPEPFDKSADAARPLVLSASFDGTSGPRIEAELGRDVRALLQWRSRAGEAPVERGIVTFGGAAPESLPRAAGLWLSGRLESASLTDLLDLQWEEPRGRPIQEWLGGADLSIGRFEALGYSFTNVSGRLRPGNRAWDVSVNADAAIGRVVVPFTFPGEVPMLLDLDRLHLGDRAAGAGKRPDPDPRKLPAIRIDLRDFVFDKRSFGHVQAELARGTSGMTLNRFTMRHAAFTAEGRGSWLVRDQAAECRLEFDVETGDVQGFMNAMQLGALVEGEKGRVSARLSWPGAPEISALNRLSGRLEISAVNGSLTSVEPGAGRVFGLMSLAHLPRRLALDFGDLTGEGLAYDTLRGTFQLTDGDAYTDNLTLRGSAAEIGIAGHTSLRYRTYDQTAIVTGQLGASLGVAGALAAGPAVGAALLLFSQIFKEPLKGATRGYYRITGSWDDPQVRRMDARELKDDRQAAQGPS
ncbi:MAG TPA: YhdP family protein [Steroidobacteraceae bacterium]